MTSEALATIKRGQEAFNRGDLAGMGDFTTAERRSARRRAAFTRRADALKAAGLA